MKGTARRRLKRLKKRKLLFLAIIFALVLLLPAAFLSQAGKASYDYDLVVAGSDPEGIAAAISAARNGLKVLLVDWRSEVGGLLTRGWLCTLDMNYDPAGNLLTLGIFQEFFQQLEGVSFDVVTARTALEKMLAAEKNVQLLLGQRIGGVLRKKNRVAAVLLENGERITAARFIDATQDADLAAMAGAGFTLGMEDLGSKRRQAVTLVLEVGGVDWDELTAALAKDPSGHSGASGTSAWGFLEEMRGYRSVDPRIRSRGLNISLQNSGNVLINAMHIFGVDALDPKSWEEALERGQKEAEFLVRYMRQNLPGFKGAFLAGTAPELYVRETRHLQGLYRLTIDDVLEHRNFWDKIALGSYPVDVQATAMDDWGAVVGNPAMYSIPLRCLIPGELTNLLVVGRGASYDSLAHGSARVVPVGIAVGEAAGVAAAISLEKGVNFHELSKDKSLVASLQERLKEQGAYLRDFEFPYALEGHPLYPVIRELRAYGLVTGRYDNDYRLEEPACLRDISLVIDGYLERALQYKFRARNLSQEQREAAVEDLLWFLEGIEGADPGALGLDELLVKYGFCQGRTLYRGETFAFLLEFLQRLN
ncbi:MAG: FAD-dependent oxidoreductase [Firmicutes bacterium]|nr:FAD-dependent oxidoreductase [Bacillota bacterium]